MADTPELLRLCERVIAEGSRVAAYMNYERDTVPDWHKDVAIPSVVLPIARALKSRLQAEAQAPTTAALIARAEAVEAESARLLIELRKANAAIEQLGHLCGRS